ARLALHAMPLSVLLVRRPRSSPLFPYTTLFRSPGDVTRLIRASRQDQAMREEATRAQAPVDHASADRIRQVVGELAEQLGWSEEPKAREGFALRVPCPHCGAGVGARCTNPGSGRPLSTQPCHPSRADALAAQLR